MAVFGVGNVTAPLDEINQYQLGRYISSNEANGQRVYFTADNVRARALVPPATTLTAFYSLCQDDLFAKTLLCSEVPKFYTWNASTKKFQRRKQGKAVEGHTKVMHCLYTVHPNNTNAKIAVDQYNGPISFQDLRTVEAVHYLSNLYSSDAHWDTALADASVQIRCHNINNLLPI
ncbi:uncharacterized protein LOC104236095 [Trichonephila clavipes]|nr:uncharacterized protein LOC104236095 [Trichonephila clavipes]